MVQAFLPDLERSSRSFGRRTIYLLKRKFLLITIGYLTITAAIVLLTPKPDAFGFLERYHPFVIDVSNDRSWGYPTAGDWGRRSRIWLFNQDFDTIAADLKQHLPASKSWTYFHGSTGQGYMDIYTPGRTVEVRLTKGRPFPAYPGDNEHPEAACVPSITDDPRTSPLQRLQAKLFPKTPYQGKPRPWK